MCSSPYQALVHQKRISYGNLLRFRVGNIIGLSLRKVPHLPMCGNLNLFMVLNISNKIGFIPFGVFLQKLEVNEDLFLFLVDRPGQALGRGPRVVGPPPAFLRPAWPGSRPALAKTANG